MICLPYLTCFSQNNQQFICAIKADEAVKQCGKEKFREKYWSPQNPQILVKACLVVILLFEICIAL